MRESVQEFATSIAYRGALRRPPRTSEPVQSTHSRFFHPESEAHTDSAAGPRRRSIPGKANNGTTDQSNRKVADTIIVNDSDEDNTPSAKDGAKFQDPGPSTLRRDPKAPQRISVSNTVPGEDELDPIDSIFSPRHDTVKSIDLKKARKMKSKVFILVALSSSTLDPHVFVQVPTEHPKVKTTAKPSFAGNASLGSYVPYKAAWWGAKQFQVGEDDEPGILCTRGTTPALCLFEWNNFQNASGKTNYVIPFAGIRKIKVRSKLFTCEVVISLMFF